MQRCERPSRSLPFPCALDNCDVTINRELGDTLDLAAGLGPSYLQPVELRSFPNAQHHTLLPHPGRIHLRLQSVLSGIGEGTVAIIAIEGIPQGGIGVIEVHFLLLTR